MRFVVLVLLTTFLHAAPKIQLGVDVFFQDGHVHELKGLKVGLVTNHTGVDTKLRSTIDLFREAATDFRLVALFSPEHGMEGVAYAGEKIGHAKAEALRIYSLYGKTRRPTDEMLEGIDTIVFDIQEIGSRSYTYASTLYYVMEEAAKRGIAVIVLDRPNPINGVIIDGPMLSENQRSFLGYINVPYCHGMTIGELARFFNDEYLVGCNLKVVPMKGWKREMSYPDTGLTWIPTSPQIPEVDSPLFYPSTGILGELDLVNIGVGYTLPFKLVGAPWINAKKFAAELNSQNLPGVKFIPFHYRPFFGTFKGEDCHGVKIEVVDPKVYRPVTVDYMILGILKTLYPKIIDKKLAGLSETKKKMFAQINGSSEILDILLNEKYIAWKLIKYQSDERKAFAEKRQKFLLY
jgi:uncharacterized protein YbbC (DUF1343 family)